MQRHLLSVVAMAMAFATAALAQTTNPLNGFISLAASAVSVVESAAASETPASTSTSAASTSPTSTAASSTSASAATSSAAAAAASGGGLSSTDKTIIIVVSAVVGGILLLALLTLCCCLCIRKRRRHRRVASPVGEHEATGYEKPVSPGRTYSPVNHSSQIPMSQQPSVPLMAATNRPSTGDHPAYRDENPFVPVPPNPRRTGPNTRSDFEDAAIVGAPLLAEQRRQSGQNLRNSRSFGRDGSAPGLNSGYNNPSNGGNYNNSRYPASGLAFGGIPATGPNNNYYDTYDGAGNGGNSYTTNRKPVPTAQPAPLNDPNRPPTPFGLNALSSNPPRQHHNNIEPALAAGAAGAALGATAAHHRNSREARRPQIDTNVDKFAPTPTTGGPNPYNTVGSPLHDMHVHQLQNSSPSSDLLRADQEIPAPTHPSTFQTVPSSKYPNTPQYQQSSSLPTDIPLPTPSQTRRSAQRPGFSTPPLVPSRSPNRRSSGFQDSTYDSNPGSYTGSGSTESWATGQMQPPSAPWEDRERRYSSSSRGSPRGSIGATGMNGSGGATPTSGKRLRFSDLQGLEGGEGYRYSQGVGEAL